MYFSCVSPSRSDLAASSLYEQGSWALRPSSCPRGRGSGLCWALLPQGSAPGGGQGGPEPWDTESSDPHSRTPSHLITVQFPLCPSEADNVSQAAPTSRSSGLSCSPAPQPFLWASVLARAWHSPLEDTDPSICHDGLRPTLSVSLAGCPYVITYKVVLNYICNVETGLCVKSKPEVP